MRKRFDHIVIGLLLGLFMPFVAVFVYYFFTYRSQTSFPVFMEYTSQHTHAIVPMLSLGCLLNLGLFFLFIWRDRLASARGIILATFAYAGWVAYMKLLA